MPKLYSTITSFYFSCYTFLKFYCTATVLSVRNSTCQGRQKVPVLFPRIICPEVEGETNASSPTETSPNAPRVKTGFFDEEYVNGQSDSALSPQYATKVAASAVKAVLPLLESDPEVARRPSRPYTPGSLHESPLDQALPVRFPRII